MNHLLRFSTTFFIITLFVMLSACSHEPIRKTHTSDVETPSAHRDEAREEVIKKVQALYQRGDYQEALDLLNATPEKTIHPNDLAEYHNLKGLILLAQKKPLQAEASFRNAVALNHTEEYKGYFQYNLATAFLEEGKSKEAANALNEIDVEIAAAQAPVKTSPEKITEVTGSTPSTLPALGAVAGVPAASPSPSSAGLANREKSEKTIIPTPNEVYSGPVNRLKIGLLIPLSGKYEDFGKKVQRSVELAFQHSTDSRAKEYEIVAEDSGDTIDSRLSALQKLVEQHQVIAIIGPLVSKGLDSLATRAAYYQVPLISIAQVQDLVSTQLFSCSISNRDQATRVVDYAMKTKGFSRFAILAPKNKPGEEMAQAFWDEVASRKGSITAFELYDPDITDFREPVDKSIGLFYTDARAKELKELADKRKEMNITKKTMKTAQYFLLPPIVDFDAVFIADEAKTVGQIIPTYGYRDAKNITFLGITSWNSQQLIQRAQEQAEGAIFPVAFNTLSPPPSTKTFYDLYVSTYSTYPGELDALAFDSAALTLRALHNSPSTREEFRKELERLQGVDGATGTISMQAHQCARSLNLYTVQKGKFESIAE